MPILGRWTVLPTLPDELAPLDRLAKNLAWSWSHDVRALFRRLDPDAWDRSGHNPVRLLREASPERLTAAAADADFLDELHRAEQQLDEELAPARWYDREVGEEATFAYFCAEYGWHESLPQYSGGLGILAGDHTKAASDLGVPLIAVGLWYPEGYFHQRIAEDGSQEAVFTRLEPDDLPLAPATDDAGDPVTVPVEAFGRTVQVRAWTTWVGRVRVVLLDLDHDGNPEDVRAWTRRLYGGDQRTRIAQEMVLGIGGVRMLRALGVAPDAWHVNEGHSAFLILERCRELVEAGVPFDVARESVAAGTAFTVHTPVTAGNDAFPFELIDQAFAGWPERLGLDRTRFHALGLADHGWGPVFSMPALALRNASHRNGVAELHGDTSRHIWRDLWPGVPTDEVPIGHVTNGVHAATWQAPEIAELLDEVLPDDWRHDLTDDAAFAPVRELDPAKLWKARRALKQRSIRFLRRRLRAQRVRHQATPSQQRGSDQLFDPERLTIGFARRFATYKRATLIFRDLDRLERILASDERPVQLVFAGKAHPADHQGQDLIRTIDTLARDPRFEGRILFAEDYDMAVGRALTRGVDVWLNNPRRPLEASGTSGQKAAMNGVLNLSILDGWWPEGYDGANGWAIGNGDAFDDPERVDAADAEALYALLEHEVVPLYYRRDATGVPVDWMHRSATAIATVTPRFNAQRMVRDYVASAYLPAARR
ncbi:MAG: alpha-glucan family phosphorylase, partial [Trueperaceae bacterium]